MTTTGIHPGLPTAAFDVDPQWIDSYGHMNSAKYISAFDEYGYGLFEPLGFGSSYTESQRKGLYMIEIHTAYRRELLAGTPLRLQLRFLASDNKRIHTLLELYNVRDNYLAATMEQLSIHVDLNTRKVEPFSAALEARMAELVQDHTDYPLPPGFSRRLTLTRKA